MAKSKQKSSIKQIPFAVEFGREEDGRWIAEVKKLPGVMAYGETKQAALRKVYVIALRTLADQAEEGRILSPISRLFNHDTVARR